MSALCLVAMPMLNPDGCGDPQVCHESKKGLLLSMLSAWFSYEAGSRWGHQPCAEP